MWCEGYIQLDLGVREQVSFLMQMASHFLVCIANCLGLSRCHALTLFTRCLQRVVAEILIVLSVKEPGENWQVKLIACFHDNTLHASHLMTGRDVQRQRV